MTTVEFLVAICCLPCYDILKWWTEEDFTNGLLYSKMAPFLH